MGTCKNCKEVFPPQELKAGYCEKCYTPELGKEHKQLENQKKKNNPLVTIVAYVLIISVAIFVFNQYKMAVNSHPPYMIEGTNCVDEDDGRNYSWISDMYVIGGVLDSNGCLINKK